ncbi:MAG: hypothetical protein EON88_32615, partial [Brevundimonas sp.]
FQLTTREWSRRLYDRRDQARALVGPERTELWLVFFAMCAKAFERGAALVYQTVAQKRRPGPSGLPLDRASLYAPSARPVRGLKARVAAAVAKVTKPRRS